MNDRAAEVLKPCPFCGGEADEYDEDGYQQIECRECGARSMKQSEPQPKEAWNRRTPDPIAYGAQMKREGIEAMRDAAVERFSGFVGNQIALTKDQITVHMHMRADQLIKELEKEK